MRGPEVENPVMCALNAQTMLARTDLVQIGGKQYMKVVCTRSKNANQWKAEIEGRKAAVNDDPVHIELAAPISPTPSRY
jgi:hypothetical protein